MRSTLLSIVAVISIGFAVSAHAECFGEAASAYGCGLAAPQQNRLQNFGSSGNEVAPYYGPQNRSPYDGLFTHKEQRAMLRSIVLGHRNRTGQANTAFSRAMNYNARAIRRVGAPSVGVWYSAGF